MSESHFQAAFNDHPAHAALQEVNRALSDLPSELLKTISEQDPNDEIPRLERVLDYIGTLLGAADSALISEQMLNNVNEPLRQIAAALPPLRDNQEFGQLQTIRNSTEALLNAGIQIAPAVGVWSKTDLSRAASALGEAATSKTRELQEGSDHLEARIGQLRNELEQATGSIKATSNEHLADLQGHVEDMKTEIEAEKARIDTAINELGSRFEEEQGDRKTAFEEARQQFSDAGQEALAKQQARTDETIKELVERGRATLDDLDTQRDEAKKLVDLVATSSTAGAFGKEAKHQREQADRWRLISIGFGLLAALVGIVAVVVSLYYDVSTSATVAKVAAVALLIGIAGYTAGQSGQHRRREQRAKRLELELIAFGPFAEPLEPEEKLKARKDFIERLFVGDPGDDHTSEQANLSDEQLSALATIAKLLQAVQK